MTHFTDVELRRFAAGGPGADRDRLIAHLAECAACAAQYAFAVRQTRLHGDAGETPGEDVAAFVSRGYGVAAPRRWLPLAAAAALLIAVAIPFALRTRHPEPAPAFRGGAIHALTPSGAIDTGAEFRWSSDVSADHFTLEIGTAAGVIYTTSAPEAGTRLDAEAWRRLTPGVDYWWSVTAYDREGRALAASPRQAFTIRTR